MLSMLVLSFFLNSPGVHADESFRPRAELLAAGFHSVSTVSVLRFAPADIPAAHSLAWPVAFEDAAHSIGNSMAEYQPFGDPYYHGGCDLRTQAEESVHAPVDGRLEAGAYSYNTRPDGSLEKFWKAWPAQDDPMYFEVAVVADNGIRYELHHIDRETLPTEIVNMLNQGGGRVTAGTVLGHVITWPDGVYHHTHYNIVLPDGTRVNPEFASPLLPDHLAPQILGSYAIMPDGSTVDYAGGTFATAPSEIVLDVVDKQDENVYEHPPTYVDLKFASGAETVWDFRQTLLGGDGHFPPLWDFFLQSVSIDGRSSTTEGGYGTGHSLIRLKVPAGASGAFRITVGDIAGNETLLNGTVVPATTVTTTTTVTK
jgi:hypothetical protein